MWFDYLTDFAASPLKVSVAAAGWSLAIVVLSLARRTANPNWKLRFLGLHLALLFLPPVFAALTWDCGMFMLACLPMGSIALLPLAFTLAFVSGYTALPWAYRWAHRRHRLDDPELARFVEENTRRLGVRPPDLYYLDTARPTAHTFTGHRPFIFVSVGLLDILDRKEMEAVLLHELGHIRDRSSLRAFASRLLPWTAPVLSFADSTWLSVEEKRADQVATEFQSTEHYIQSARLKTSQALAELSCARASSRRS